MKVRAVLFDVRYNFWLGDKEKSGSICYRKFSGKGVDFNMWKVKVLTLVGHEQSDIYLKKTKDNFISPSPTVYPQLLKCLYIRCSKNSLKKKLFRFYLSFYFVKGY